MNEAIAVVGLFIAVIVLSVILFKTYKTFDEGIEARRE